MFFVYLCWPRKSKPPGKLNIFPLIPSFFLYVSLNSLYGTVEGFFAGSVMQGDVPALLGTW